MAETKAYFRLADIDIDLYEEYVKVFARMREIETQFIRKFRDTPENRVIAGTSAHKTPQYHVHHVSGIVPTSLQVTYDVLVPLQPIKYSTIESSVLNQLLNSKLLTDAEKRSLLQEQGILKPKGGDDVVVVDPLT